MPGTDGGGADTSDRGRGVGEAAPAPRPSSKVSSTFSKVAGSRGSAPASRSVERETLSPEKRFFCFFFSSKKRRTELLRVATTPFIYYIVIFSKDLNPQRKHQKISRGKFSLALTKH